MPALALSFHKLDALSCHPTNSTVFTSWMPLAATQQTASKHCLRSRQKCRIRINVMPSVEAIDDIVEGQIGTSRLKAVMVVCRVFMEAVA